MGTLAWFRAARRVAGLSNHPEYPSLETLLEAEAGQPHSGFFYAARIVPAVGILVGAAVFIPLAILFGSLFFIGTAGLSILGVGLGILFNVLDHAISPARKQIRRMSTELWSRYGIGSLVGVEPVVSPTVGQVLDEAASIYLRHRPSGHPRSSSVDAYGQAVRALESAMARMMELAASKSAQVQELEFESGWALPLLHEMRATDRALSEVQRYTVNGALATNPVAELMSARAELTGVVSAMEELEQRQSN